MAAAAAGAAFVDLFHYPVVAWTSAKMLVAASVNLTLFSTSAAGQTDGLWAGRCCECPQLSAGASQGSTRTPLMLQTTFTKPVCIVLLTSGSQRLLHS